MYIINQILCSSEGTINLHLLEAILLQPSVPVQNYKKIVELNNYILYHKCVINCLLNISIFRKKLTNNSGVYKKDSNDKIVLECKNYHSLMPVLNKTIFTTMVANVGVPPED